MDFGGGNGRFARLAAVSGFASRIYCVDIPPALSIQYLRFLETPIKGGLIEGWKMRDSDLQNHLRNSGQFQGVTFLLPDQALAHAELIEVDLFYCSDMIHELTESAKNNALNLCETTSSFAYFSFAERYDLQELDVPWTYESLGFPAAWEVVAKEKRYWPDDYWQVVFNCSH